MGSTPAEIAYWDTEDELATVGIHLPQEYLWKNRQRRLNFATEDEADNVYARAPKQSFY